MHRVRLIRLVSQAAVLAAVVFAAAGAGGAAAAGAPPVPELASPADGAIVDAVPVFSWDPAPGVDRYDFQIAADPGFTTPVTGIDLFRTRNARATLKKTVEDGTYWWRVRSVSSANELSAWSTPRSFEKLWDDPPTLVAPAEGEEIVYPSALVFRWSPVPSARTYEVTVARDLAFTSIALRQETDATSFAYPNLLTPNTTYFWGVRPLDGGRHPGAPSAVGSFRWAWPSTMASEPQARDLADDYSQIYEPELSWDPVPGASRYEVEVNSTAEFAPSAKTCCSGTSIASPLVPTVALPDNAYYWRVRAISPAGDVGDWNNGQKFTKEFGRTPIQNLRMRDNDSDPGTDVDPAAAGYQTRVPIVRWDPYPGASSYLVEVVPFQSGRCNWSATTPRWDTTTSTTAWTPLGTGLTAAPPYNAGRLVTQDGTPLVPGTYCVRMRPRDVDGGLAVFGDYTYMNGDGQAFQWLGVPAAERDCAPWPGCHDGYLASGSYVLPGRGTTTPRMPLFTWKPIARPSADGDVPYGSYFVLVAKDEAFHTVVDYVFTRLPAYAPRNLTYPDETTRYYWAVLPAEGANGSFAAANPLVARASDFQKLSVQPTLVAPADGAVVTRAPTFEWEPAEAARRYRLEVSKDESFNTTSLLETVTTNAVAYRSNTTFPSDTVVYWRVRGEDDAQQPMTWSETRTLRRPLPTPLPSPVNPTSGDFVPTLLWSPVQGAVSYDFRFEPITGVAQASSRGAAAYTSPSPPSIFGIGAWRWQVRANFPTSGGAVPGPYTELASFMRELPAPTNPTTDAGARHVLLSWLPRSGPGNGIKEYRLQTSSRSDFATVIEDDRTENRRYVPLMTALAYAPGSTIFWRVAAVDGGGNTGTFSAPQTFVVPLTATPPPPPPPPPAPPPPPPSPPPPSPPPPPPPVEPPPVSPPPPSPPPPPPPPVEPPPAEPTPPPAAPRSPSTASRTTLSVAKTRRNLIFRGRVTPSGAGKVTVTLLRKYEGRYVRLASKRVTLTAAGRYTASFRRPRRGTYKAMGAFAGDSQRRSSRASSTFRC